MCFAIKDYYLVSGGEEGNILIWEYHKNNNNKPIKILEGHKNAILSIEFNKGN